MYSAIGCLDRKYLENNSWEGLLRSQLLRNYHIFTLYEQKWDNLTEFRKGDMLDIERKITLEIRQYQSFGCKIKEDSKELIKTTGEEKVTNAIIENTGKHFMLPTKESESRENRPTNSNKQCITTEFQSENTRQTTLPERHVENTSTLPIIELPLPPPILFRPTLKPPKPPALPKKKRYHLSLQELMFLNRKHLESESELIFQDTVKSYQEKWKKSRQQEECEVHTYDEVNAKKEALKRDLKKMKDAALAFFATRFTNAKKSEHRAAKSMLNECSLEHDNKEQLQASVTLKPITLQCEVPNSPLPKLTDKELSYKSWKISKEKSHLQRILTEKTPDNIRISCENVLETKENLETQYTKESSSSSKKVVAKIKEYQVKSTKFPMFF